MVFGLERRRGHKEAKIQVRITQIELDKRILLDNDEKQIRCLQQQIEGQQNTIAELRNRSRDGSQSLERLQQALDRTKRNAAMTSDKVRLEEENNRLDRQNSALAVEREVMHNWRNRLNGLILSMWGLTYEYVYRATLKADCPYKDINQADPVGNRVFAGIKRGLHRFLGDDARITAEQSAEVLSRNFDADVAEYLGNKDKEDLQKDLTKIFNEGREIWGQVWSDN
ncbi:uncharacterized protein Z519_06436 [Cladophialophora bantiana CBS 173.52]|uniref:Kinetochore protein SPC25 n=1 Tax=Cladophialophora bantiana (strain ATCC 10958 / CBS 173.52 / CDC B-1940 / NIH 8579) TaxID=1442370 RepID=A0A0D2I6X0_CLAB1|nr:uncharacterized protein Z519_06436 [Cladophialophora bantiana CBS 173.52]KIW92589.1 hypothetical protein Z519_06436 [Cladophialophora bantiana CBS 173.52]